MGVDSSLSLLLMEILIMSIEDKFENMKSVAALAVTKAEEERDIGHNQEHLIGVGILSLAEQCAKEASITGEDKAIFKAIFYHTYMS